MAYVKPFISKLPTMHFAALHFAMSILLSSVDLTEILLDFILSKFSYFFKTQTKEFVSSILNTWINGKSEGQLQFARCIMCDKQPIAIISLGEKVLSI